MANSPDIIIKNRKEKMCILIDVATPADRNVIQKGSRKETKIQQFMYRDTENVEHEMYENTSSNWSYRNSNIKRKEIFGSHTRKTFSGFTAKTSHIIRKVLQSEKKS